MRILIAGDIHCDTSQVEYLIRMAKQNNCSVILNVGDFGYWPHTDSGQKFLRKVERMLDDAGLTLYWIDGNHENFIALGNAVSQTDDFCSIYSTPDYGQHEFMESHIKYVPRGYAWEWDGVKFLGMGGAVSIDREWRLQREAETGKRGTLYWPQEKITEADIDRGIENGANGVDILICHDAPLYVDIPMELMNISAKGLDIDSNINRRRLNSLVERLYDRGAAPKLIFHGHFHLRHNTPYERTGLLIPCIGLDMNGSAQSSWYVLDTEEFKNA